MKKNMKCLLSHPSKANKKKKDNRNRTKQFLCSNALTNLFHTTTLQRIVFPTPNLPVNSGNNCVRVVKKLKSLFLRTSLGQTPSPVHS